MVDVLRSEQVSNEIPVADRIYDWLVGSWNVTARDYDEVGGFSETLGEWHFFRALEGRAVQDVWICPVRTQRYEGMPKTSNRYGTSIRFYRPSTKGWHVVWINPVSGTVSTLEAKKVGDDVVQRGVDDQGNVFRWVFTEIRKDSCRWFGERSYDNETSWTLEVEFLMTRQPD